MALLALAGLGFYPSIWLATRFSADGALENAYVHLLHVSQWTLAGALLAGGGIVASGVRFGQNGAKRLGPRWTERLPLAIPILGIGAAGLVQWGLFGNVPHITDATSHWFQAQIFASGRLSVPVPPCLPAFFQHNVVMGIGGQWHTKYLPGQALWLFWPLRCLMMPLAFALFLAGFQRIVAHYYDRQTSWVAAGLLLVSPLMLLLAGSFMSHVTVLMWMCGCWAFFLKTDAARTPAGVFAWAALAGFCGGMGGLTRPQDALLAGLFLLALRLPAWWRNRRRVPWLIVGVAVGAALPLAMLLYWNHALYGHVLASGYNFSTSAAISQTPIIHDTLGFANGFTWTRALKQTAWVGMRLNQALLGWPAALPLLLFALVPRILRRKNGICLLGAAWLYLPYFFFHYYGFELEARYAALAAPLLAIAIASWLVAVFRAAAGDGADDGRRPLAAWLLAFFLYAGAYYWPVYLVPRYARAYEEASPEVHRAALRAHLQLPALILLPNEGFGYSSGFIHNDPRLEASILYARDLPAERPCLLAGFPDRRFYRYRPDVDGPLSGRFEPLARSDAGNRAIP